MPDILRTQTPSNRPCLIVEPQIETKKLSVTPSNRPCLIVEPQIETKKLSVAASEKSLNT